jgi:hypothetical protein
LISSCDPEPWDGRLVLVEQGHLLVERQPFQQVGDARVERAAGVASPFRSVMRSP